MSFIARSVSKKATQRHRPGLDVVFILIANADFLHMVLCDKNLAQELHIWAVDAVIMYALQYRALDEFCCWWIGRSQVASRARQMIRKIAIGIVNFCLYELYE